MSEDGNLLIHEIRNTLGRIERLEYSWEGGPIAYVDINLLNPSDEYKDGLLKIGPYRLRLLEEIIWSHQYKFIREDYPFWQLAVGWHKASRLFDLIYRRTIITLAVWRLADYNGATVPGWRDVHILRKIAELLKQ